MTIPEKNQSLLNSVSSQLFLATNDFNLITPSPNINDEDFILVYESQNNRKISIEFYEGFFLNFYIYKEEEEEEEEEESYRGGHKGFSISDWIKQTNYQYYSYPLFIDSYQGTFEEKLQQLLDFYNLIFETTELSNIISGDNWEYFPHDWGTDK